jgi:aminoglycoside phosphotransferase family enzyme
VLGSPEIDIERKVAFLASAAAYGADAAPVERIETHFSWVFLTGAHVFKLKKPVSNGGADFSPLAARRRNAEEEVRLNRRLAPAVYLGVVPLTLDPSGLALGGKGVVVDWLVKMVRLPDSRMLDRCIARHSWRTADIHVLGAGLAKFFTTARPVKLEPRAYLDRFRAECRSSRDAFCKTGGPALRQATGDVARRIEAFLDGSAMPARRIEDDRIVEGHGDLRPEHICLGSSLRIIDCLEYRAALRLLDPVDELSFLGMECGRLGAPGIGQILFYQYRRRSGDRPPAMLIDLYRAIGAMIRARIAILHLREPAVGDPAKWPRRAAEYLAIAGRAARRLRP